jgi:tetratricopeptide (TPR) repeat protein
VAAQANDFETAEQMFASIWSTYPDTAKLGYSLALAQYRANRIKESQVTLRKLIGAGHESSDIYDLLAWCFEKQNDFKQAVAAMDQAIALDPSRESNYLDVGMMLLELHRPTGALVAAEKAVKVAPSSYQAYRLKGLAETRLAKIADAEKSYARAIELNPADPEAILGLASAQWDDGKTQEAEATFKKGIELLPGNAILYQEYGSMLLKLGGSSDAAREARAVSLLQTAIALDGGLAEPHYQLGKLALTKGSYQEALGHLETAAKLNPRSSKIHFSLAGLYRRLGRAEDATKELQLYKSLKTEEEKSASGASAGGGKLPGSGPSQAETQPLIPAGAP